MIAVAPAVAIAYVLETVWDSEQSFYTFHDTVCRRAGSDFGEPAFNCTSQVTTRDGRHRIYRFRVLKDGTVIDGHLTAK